MELNTVNISASIVLYKEDEKTLQRTIDSFLKTPLSKQLFLIDNSPTDSLRNIANSSNISYIFNGKNVGFGRAHNLVIDEIKKTSKYHLILNPDVYFEPTVIPRLVEQLESNECLAMVSPRVTYPNGQHQYTCRKFPTFFDLIIRRLGIYKTRIKDQEYRNIDLSKTFHPNAIHGCFMLFKTQDFINLNGFDKRYFLYMEDIDVCKKISIQKKKILYYPFEEITHVYRKASAKKLTLLFHHFSSAIKYFIKWN